jgi:hypothetical protein
VHFSHSIIPSLSWVCIQFPSVSFVWSCPIRNFETLEECSWSSIEVNISNSFKKGFWMEELSINMIMNIWLFMEFIWIEVFYSNTYIILN